MPKRKIILKTAPKRKGTISQATVRRAVQAVFGPNGSITLKPSRSAAKAMAGKFTVKSSSTSAKSFAAETSRSLAASVK